MSVAAFDTHAFVKRLTAAGMPEAQAEVLADEHRRLVDDRLATKDDISKLGGAIKDEIAELGGSMKDDFAKVGADIARLEATTKTEITRLEAWAKIELAKMDAKIEASKAELVRWMLGQTLVIIGVLMALLRFGH